jgi:hypothetical protein
MARSREPSLSARDAAGIVRRRLAAQRISTTAFAHPEEVVSWLGAVQAQDYLGALWAVGLRVQGACEEDVERAIAERKIVRTWPMRGTLHFVAAGDARWMVELLARKPLAAAAGRFRALGLDERVLKRARDVVIRSLEGGRRLARPDVYRVLERAKIATDGQRGVHVLWHLAHERLICFGPREGKQHTLVLFEEWLPGAKGVPREEALAALASRYFSGHGPATLADFAWWSGLKLADARLAVLAAGEALAMESIGAEPYFYAPSAASPASSRGRAHVLPAFDEFLVGYVDRSAALDAADQNQVNDGGGILSPTIVYEGRVIGTWKRTLARRELVVSAAPFVALDEAKSRALDRALRRYAQFLGREVRREDASGRRASARVRR